MIENGFTASANSALIYAINSATFDELVWRPPNPRVGNHYSPDHSVFFRAAGCRTRPSFDQKVGSVTTGHGHAVQQRLNDCWQNSFGFLAERPTYSYAIIFGRTPTYERRHSRVIYVLGSIALRKSEIVIVSDAFDFYYPQLGPVTNRGGRATITFFQSTMKEPWQKAGLFAPDSPIKFIDLSNDARAILGVDFGSSIRAGAKQGGFFAFKIDSLDDAVKRNCGDDLHRLPTVLGADAAVQASCFNDKE